MPESKRCYDRCGLAGGTWFAQTLGGDFNTTKYAKLGDKGSAVLPYRPTGVVWKRGEIVHPTWFLRANHGGGTHTLTVCLHVGCRC